MFRELDFNREKHSIEDFRLKAYLGALSEGLDRFDAHAHHFALFDEREQMLGLARVLRSDEVERFELSHESRMQQDALPSNGLGLELSRACTLHGSAGLHLYQLCKGVESYALRIHADYLIAKTVGKLLPIYEHFGFTVFAPPFTSDFFDDNRTVYPIIYRWSHPKEDGRDDEPLVY